MPASIIQFRHPAPKAPRIERRTPPRQVGYPSTTSLVCDDGELSLDPAARTVQQVVPRVLPQLSEPAVYVDRGVVLDLGDCTATRTLLHLTPEAAEAWGRALINAASMARKQGE